MALLSHLLDVFDHVYVGNAELILAEAKPEDVEEEGRETGELDELIPDGLDSVIVHNLVVIVCEIDH